MSLNSPAAAGVPPTTEIVGTSAPWKWNERRVHAITREKHFNYLFNYKLKHLKGLPLLRSNNS